MTGRVVAGLEIVVDLSVGSHREAQADVSSILDTGFDGAVVLPNGVIHLLGLSPTGVRRATPADGVETLLAAYEAEVIWHGTPRSVLDLEAAEAMIGMGLVRGSRVCFDAVEGGQVVIEPLP